MGEFEELFDGFKDQIERSVRAKLDSLAQDVLSRALYYRERLVSSSVGHDYTGNLVNSICVGIYLYGTYQRGYFGSKQTGKAPIMGKMTNKKDGSPRKYKFGKAMQESLAKRSGGTSSGDYSGSNSVYYATVRTDTRTVNAAVAEQVLRTLRPMSSNGYSLILAYPVEYASFIEKERQSTGIILVEDEFKAKKEAIAKWITQDVALTDVDSAKGSDVWDKIAARDMSYRQVSSVDDNPDEIMQNILGGIPEGGHLIRPGITIASADAKSTK